MHDEWYRAPGFGDGHVSLGWAAAFKGAGHDRLVSRRWLDGGPWKVIEGPEDVSLVLFHDLDADAEQALKQARPAHEQMGIGDAGGFIQSGFAYERELAGLYVSDRRVMKVVVMGRELDDLELLEWAAARKGGANPRAWRSTSRAARSRSRARRGTPRTQGRTSIRPASAENHP